MTKRVVVLQRAPKNPRPTLAPLMDRPITPHIDTRNGLASSRNSISHIASPSIFETTDPKASQLYQIAQDLENAKSPEEIEAIIQDFTKISISLSENGTGPQDVNAFYLMQPNLEKLIDGFNENHSPLLILLLDGVRHLASNLLTNLPPSEVKLQSPAKPKIKSPIITQPIIGKSKIPPLKPAAPVPISSLKEPSETPQKDTAEKKKSKSDTPKEQMSNLMARIIYKLSVSATNDGFFLKGNLCPFILALTSNEHKLETRVFAARCLFNETNNKEFCKLLFESPNFSLLYAMLAVKGKHQEFVYTKVSGIFKNIVNDPSTLQELGKNELPKLLVSALLRVPSGQFAYNVFSLLKNFTCFEDIRAQLIDEFTPPVLISLFLKYLKKQQEPNFVDRLTCVFADFAANEDSFLEAASQVSEDVDITILTDLLGVEAIASIPESTARVLQVIADLSVLKENSELLALSENIPPLFKKCTFKEDDQVGLYLLCTAANFTFHDKQWSPSELIAALPVAIVSKNLASITEALRILCNLALLPNSDIINSKLPELLVILLSHPSQDIVCYSLQTLTNLVNHAGIRRRFSSSNGVNAVLELLDSEEIDEAILEAICKLIMNYGALSADEAQSFIEKIEEFDASGVEIIPLFLNFLRKQTLVSV